MKTLKSLGLIIALIVSSVAFSAAADAKVKAKKHHSRKHAVKGKKVVKSGAKTKAKKSVKKSASEETAKLSTDINFNDSVLHGRYQTPDDATAKVENEKTLQDLLAVRTQFKDRLKKSSEQN